MYQNTRPNVFCSIWETIKDMWEGPLRELYPPLLP